MIATLIQVGPIFWVATPDADKRKLDDVSRNHAWKEGALLSG
jgi:hypothetical protein